MGAREAERAARMSVQADDELFDQLEAEARDRLSGGKARAGDEQLLASLVLAREVRTLRELVGLVAADLLRPSPPPGRG